MNQKRQGEVAREREKERERGGFDVFKDRLYSLKPKSKMSKDKMSKDITSPHTSHRSKVIPG
jgi:hypothetical protein